MKTFMFVSAVLILSMVTFTFWSCSQPMEERYNRFRNCMVTRQIESRGINTKPVLDAMRKVKRHLFVPEDRRDEAYDDRPIPIGENQTISQPYIVALMTDLMQIQKSDVVLEIGTGSGYQAAILAELAKDVYSIEIIETLGKRAEKVLYECGYQNIHIRIGDGYQGWPEKAPFDKIIITAAPPKIPQPLIDQLKVGGIMVLPVGMEDQQLIVLTKDENGVHRKKITSVVFVPMTGEIQKK